MRKVRREIAEVARLAACHVSKTARRGAPGYAGKKAKEPVIGIRQRGGDLRFFHAEDVKAGTLATYIKENIADDVDVIMTDELITYPYALKRAGVPDHKHKTVRHRA